MIPILEGQGSTTTRRRAVRRGPIHAILGLATLAAVSACTAVTSGPSLLDGRAQVPTASGSSSFGSIPAGEGYHRHITGISVTDAAGQPIDQPFLGGFNIPRPQLVDIDGDGDQDLFVQETSGKIMFFEHVPEAETPFQWRSDDYQDLEIGEWYRFVDLDRDGDHDLLAEQPFSYVRYYRNDGTRQAPHFVQAADTIRDTEGRAIFSDRQNIPNATDIDGDGRMDLLLSLIHI